MLQTKLLPSLLLVVKHILFTVNRKYAAHDEKSEAKKGDRVTIVETRPISKTKKFKLDKILERAHGSIELKEDEV